MPQKCRKKREMIVVDEREPVGELPPPFPPRNVVVKDDDDVRKFYDLKREIGRGRFGTVYLVNDKETGQKFAAKFVNTKRNQDRGNVEREIEIMKALNAEKPHPRLIQLYDAFDMVKEMCLILEIVDGGELFERVIDDDFVLTERACTIFVRQICEGVEFIHSKNVLHLDMKPENILCLSREGNRIKICDFGLARKYDPRKKLQVLFGTPEFVAPEVVNFEPISFGTDMWSVGVITYVLLSGLSPFMGHNYVETMTNVTKNKYDFEDEAFKSVSDDAKDFIQKLLVLDKSLRLTPAQCRHHNWLKKPPAITSRRSLLVSESESESETEEEVDIEDVSIEEKILREARENEKGKKRREEEFEKERQKAEAKRKELEEQAVAKRKEIEKQEEEQRRETERQEEAKRKELERLEEEKQRERKRQLEAERKEQERREAEKKRELEKQAEAKKKELERQAEEKRKEEELELTKKHLKEFVERWNSHPNSPYLIGTPISLDLQRIVQTGGWNSRDSFASVIVGPPSDPGDISEPEDDLDNSEQDDFIRYTIDSQNKVSKQLSPEEVAKELEEKLTALQQEEMVNNKDVTNKEVELQNKANLEKSIVNTADTSLINNNEGVPKTEVSVVKEAPTVEVKNDKLHHKTGEKNLSKKLPETKRKTAENNKEAKESKLEKHKKAYEERKRKLKNLEEEKKRKEEELEEALKAKATQKEENIPDHRSSSLESFDSSDSFINNQVRKDDALTTNRTRPPEEKIKPKEPPPKQKTEDKLLEKDSASETLKKINEKPLSDYKKEYEEYLKLVSQAQDKPSAPQGKEESKTSSHMPRVNGNLNSHEPMTPHRQMNGLEKSATVSTIKELEKKESGKQNKGVNERKTGAGIKKPFIQRFRFGKEKSTDSKPSKQKDRNISDENVSVNSKPIEVNIEEHKKLYQEYLKMVGEDQNKVEVKPNVNEAQKSPLAQRNKAMDSRLSSTNEGNLKERSRELQRKVSDAYKAAEAKRKISTQSIENAPKEPLKRPEIIALQNEEFGSGIPRQRKVSAPHYEGGECFVGDQSSMPDSPKEPLKRPEIAALKNEGYGGGVPRQRKISVPHYEGGECLIIDQTSTPGSPKLERSDAFDENSRGSTPTKQLKKQPSRDVPISTRDDSPRQRRPSRDVPVSYISVENDNLHNINRRPSRDLSSEANPSLSRNASYEERPPSRETREGTPANRRPSRDVPLTPSQADYLTGASALSAPDQVLETQAWPDLIVVPQGEQVESDEECRALKDSLDVPVATLVKSPSGTLLSVPGVTVSQHEKESKTEASVGTPQEYEEESTSTYVAQNKLVAWILDIGTGQTQRSPTVTTSDRVSQWESRDSSPRPLGRSSRDPSPRRRDRSPALAERCRDKSPVSSKQQPSLYPLSREPSALSLKSSVSSENIFIQTPWGAMKKSPSRTNLSNSPSFEISESTKESQKADQSNTEDFSQYSQSDDHMSVDSSTRSPSPKMTNNLLQKQDTLEISEIKEFQSYSRLSDELPPKPPEKGHRSNREENLNINNMPRIDESKCHTLPRSAKLMKMNSVTAMKSSRTDKKDDNKKSGSVDNRTSEAFNTDSLKRKSKFPSSPNQKKKLGPLLFSAQDRISQFEQTQTPRSARPITRTRSNMVFSKTEKLHSTSTEENTQMYDKNKNSKAPLISTHRPAPIGLMRSPTFT